MQREDHLELRSHKRSIELDDRIECRLMKLGLIHISKVKHVNIDIPLLKAMVEFWRPEMHTFHFSVGEMIVTLKDVAFIYGLRTEGIPVRGNTKGPWEEKICAQLFPHVNLGNWARETSEEADARRNIKLKWLRENYRRVPAPGASDDDLDQYTCAVAVELFGTLMFPDISQNFVPAYYLELVSGNLNEVLDFNWGGATLASLYRGLDRAAMRFKTVTGPWMLLLFWAWSYLPVCRLTVAPITDLGQPSIDSCVPFGRKWGEAHSFLGSHHRGTVENARDQIAVLDMEDVNRYPYVQDQALMPRVAQEDSIERHRWDITHNLLGFQHGTYRDDADYSTIFAIAYAQWAPNALAERQLEERPWTATDTLKYFRWLWKYGGSKKPTPCEEPESRIRRRDRLPISQRQYTHMGSRLRNTGNSALKNALHALGLVVKKGCRRVGKAILTNCRAQLEDASMPFRMEDLLEQRGLATKIEEMPDSGDESSSGHPTVPTNLQAEDIVQPDGRLNTRRLDDILGPRLSVPTQVTTSGPTPSMHSASA
ncbi:hypothetical protein LUZ63_000080 [Rhynchospora breviuscula]|uniref:Aminotransferase-like plant mobile domain-containing protein n=1 Tax=Rhynchospora breviuscula TaxID=2022672 RepID=A0A9Q0HVV0_9POAL|nr:hypothetical protein LUZ63_000080 [Rhynchospora breviuscula]